ncbi:hypothetical protein [Nocardia sp. NPDC060259]|uniref:hypothetical protein n=1 Tax=Nocardia sp. NPDC060259 TaxID=3347088 RepID=UPI003647E502
MGQVGGGRRQRFAECRHKSDGIFRTDLQSFPTGPGAVACSASTPPPISSSTRPISSSCRERRYLTVGMNCLIWVTNHFSDTYRHVRELTDAALFAELDSAVERNGIRERIRVDALNHLARVVVHTRRDPRELTPDDLLACHAALLASGRNGNSVGLAWDMLRSHNVFPPGTPTLRAARNRGQLSIEELVDRYQLTSQPVRDLLIRYLTERATGLDHVSLRGLVGLLAGTFWKDIEEHHPGLDTIDLPPAVAAAWKEWAGFKRHPGSKGEPRKDRYSVFFAVRALYRDSAHWAVEDPTWAPLGGPMPDPRRRRPRQHEATAPAPRAHAPTHQNPRAAAAGSRRQRRATPCADGAPACRGAGRDGR